MTKEMEHVRCALCGADDTAVVATKGDLTEDMTTVACRRCALVYLNPRPTIAAYDDFHVADFLAQRHGISAAGDVAYKVKGSELAMKSAVEHFLRPVLRPGIRVLDVGCGIGTQLHLIKKDVPDAVVRGIELATVDVDAAKKFYGLDLFAGSLEQFASAHPAERFDLIVLHHTFEHLPDPRSSLRTLASLLAPRGTLFIAVPNVMNIRKRPEIFFQIAHPYAYAPATLQKMLALAGFSVIRFNRRGAYPGGMEVLAQRTAEAEKPLPADALREGATAAAVLRHVSLARIRFAALRAIRDAALFLLPKRLRYKIGTEVSKVLKRV